MLRRSPVIFVLPALFAILIVSSAIAADDATKPKPALTAKEKAQIAKDKEAMAGIQNLVGLWRRGGAIAAPSSGLKSWSEEADWLWEFEDGRASIVFEADDGKLYTEGRILPGKTDGSYVLTATQPGGKIKETFTGKVTGKDKTARLEFTADKSIDGRPDQILMYTVARGKRLVIVYNRKVGSGNTYARMAQLGYTRKGSGFASAAGPQRECVVTGGEGDRAVTYKGKTYYVCCRGCLIEFQEDPDGTMREFFARKEKERKEREAAD